MHNEARAKSVFLESLTLRFPLLARSVSSGRAFFCLGSHHLSYPMIRSRGMP